MQQSLSSVHLSPKSPHALTDIIDVVSATITVRKEKRIVMRASMNCWDALKILEWSIGRSWWLVFILAKNNAYFDVSARWFRYERIGYLMRNWLDSVFTGCNLQNRQNSRLYVNSLWYYFLFDPIQLFEIKSISFEHLNILKFFSLFDSSRSANSVTTSSGETFSEPARR